MTVSFLNDIKSCTSALLKAFDVISGDVGAVDYFKTNDLDCWSNSGAYLRLNYIELTSGIFFFEIIDRILISEYIEEPITLKGSHNAYNKIVDDIFFKQYRIAIDYDKGINFIRKRYLTDENSLGVFCDYSISKSISNEIILNYQLTLSRAYHDHEIENSRINYYLSIFITNTPNHNKGIEIDPQVLLIVEENCLNVEYNPLKNEASQYDGRNTYIFSFDCIGKFVKAAMLNVNNKGMQERMDDEKIKNISIRYFGIEFNNENINLISTFENIMKCVDNKEIVDMKECIVKNTK